MTFFYNSSYPYELTTASSLIPSLHASQSVGDDNLKSGKSSVPNTLYTLCPSISSTLPKITDNPAILPLKALIVPIAFEIVRPDIALAVEPQNINN